MVEMFNRLREVGMPVEMAFSREEYDRRVARVREAMGRADVDVLLVHHAPNFCYLAGYQSPLSNWYACMVLPREGEPIAHICDIEVPNLMVHGWDNGNIHTIDWRAQRDGPAHLAEILKERGLADKRIGVESRLAGCRANVALELGERLPAAKIMDASDLVLRFRAIKSPREMEYVREAARLTDIGLLAGLAEVAPGKTDTDMLAAAYEAMARAGSEYLSIEPLAYCGPFTSVSHVTAKRRLMKVGDTANIELTGVYQRYSAPVFRSAVLGEPSDLVRRLTEFSLLTLDLLYSNARPGRTIADVARSVSRGLEGHIPPELPTRGEPHFYGYSVGIGLPPDWVEHSMFLDENHDRVLEEGMVFHTPASARDPGTVGVAFSDTLAVTATGAEALSRVGRDLLVVPV